MKREHGSFEWGSGEIVACLCVFVDQRDLKGLIC